MIPVPSEKAHISIIVPVLNEADGIEQLREKLESARALLQKMGSIQLVFIDDGSTDQTPSLLRSVFQEDKNCTIVVHDKNRGVGAAFRTGFQHATGDIVCTIDADCSYDPEGLKRLIDVLMSEGADIAVASPYHPDGAVEDVVPWRLFVSRVCSAIYRLLSPVQLYTYTSIFRVYRARVIETVSFEANGFVSAAEILIHASEQGYRIAEVPMVLHGRKVGVTKMKVFRTVTRHLGMMTTILLQRFGLRGRRAGRIPARALPHVRPASENTARYSYLSNKESTKI
jgi:dolichol-phosphate mannosyltransferase